MARPTALLALVAMAGATVSFVSPVGAEPPVQSAPFVYDGSTCSPTPFVLGGEFFLVAAYDATSDGDDDVNVGDVITFTLTATAHQNQEGPVEGNTTFELPSGPVTVDFTVADTQAPATYGTTTYTVQEGDVGTVFSTRVSGLSTTSTFNGREVDCTTPDGSGIIETYVNRPPDAVDDAVTTDQDQAVTMDVLANDVLANDSGSVAGTPADASAQDDESTFTDFSLTGDATDGTCTIAGNEITYTPDAGFVGDDTCTYTLTDNDESTDSATLTVTVVESEEEPEEEPEEEATPGEDVDADTGSLAPAAATPTVAQPTFAG